MNEQQTSFRWWEKALTCWFKIGMITGLRNSFLPITPLHLFFGPDLEGGEQYTVAHWCSACRTYRRDHLRDPVSESEQVVCGNCGAMKTPRLAVDRSRFYDLQCKRVARRIVASRREQFRQCGSKRKAKRARAYRRVYRQLFYRNLGMHLPDHRGGKTFAELELHAVWVNPRLMDRVVTYSVNLKMLEMRGGGNLPQMPSNPPWY